MRRVITILTMAAVWGGLSLFGMAADPNANKPPEAVKVETRTAASVNAGLRAEIHRTMAALIEAQAAEKPDPAQIEKLTQQLQDLRGKLQAQKTVIAGNQAGDASYPWGGLAPTKVLRRAILYMSVVTTTAFAAIMSCGMACTSDVLLERSHGSATTAGQIR